MLANCTSALKPPQPDDIKMWNCGCLEVYSNHSACYFNSSPLFLLVHAAYM